MDSSHSSVPALILRSGEKDINKVTPLDSSPFLIGRGVESSLKVRQKSVSRKQCSIERNGKKWEIKSLGSRPMSVGGNLLFEDSIKTLKCSDIIELPGDIKFEFRCSPDQNGRCCEDSATGIPTISINDSHDFLTPDRTSRPSTSASSRPSLSVDQLSHDSPSIVEVEDVDSFNTDRLLSLDGSPGPAPITSSVFGSPLRLSDIDRNINVTPKKRIEPVSGDVGDHGDDESDLRKKVKWQEAKIQFLQMKLQEKETVSGQLESVKQENDNLVNQVAALKRKLASKDIVELELRVLQESVKYREEDKRSKDVLQEQIDALKSESSHMKIEHEKMKIEHEKVIAELENSKNKNAELMEKNKILEEKVKEKNSPMAVDLFKDGNVDEHCCAVGAARTSTLVDLMERELNCSICGEMFIEATVTNCNHTFCSHCLREWQKLKRECPFCRTIVVQAYKISFLDDLIGVSLKFLSPKLWAERDRLVRERFALAVQPPPAKRSRGRGRTPARNPRNARAAQNAHVPIPYQVDPISGFPENFLEDMALGMLLMGPGLHD